MIKFSEFIFSLFPHYYKNYDSYKVNGKGLLERFLEATGGELDDETIKYLDEDNAEYYLNNLDPLLCDDDLLPHLMDDLSNPPKILTTTNGYRKLLKYIVSLYKIRGTKASYELYFKLLGFIVSITEHTPDPVVPIIYDNGFTYDDNINYDDLGCIFCSDYTIIISGNYIITPVIINQINSIIFFNEPINARLLGLIFNPTPLSEDLDISLNDEPMVITEFNFLNFYDDSLIYDDSLLYDDINIINQTIIPIP